MIKIMELEFSSRFLHNVIHKIGVELFELCTVRQLALVGIAVLVFSSHFPVFGWHLEASLR